MHTRRLTSTLRRRIRFDPAARLVDTTAGSSWGVIPTAMARENNSASRIGFCSTTLMAKIETVSAPATYTSSREKRRRPTWKPVSSWCVPSPAAIPPNSVADPDDTTTPRPPPACTTVPISAHPASSARGVPSGTAAVVLSTGNDSPVRTDSSHSRPVTRSNRMSAGTTSPSFSSTTSPGTSAVDVHRGRPPVADDERAVVDLGVQRLRGFLGAVLVDEPERDRQPDDHPDDDGRALLADDVGHEGGGQQQPEQRGPQLVPEHRQQPGPVRGHGVGAVTRLPPDDLVAGQALVHGGVELAQHVVARPDGRGRDAGRSAGVSGRGGDRHRRPVLGRRPRIAEW